MSTEHGPQPPSDEPIKIEHGLDRSLGYDTVTTMEAMTQSRISTGTTLDYLRKIEEDFEARGWSEEYRERMVDEIIKSGQFSESTWQWIEQREAKTSYGVTWSPGRYGSLEDAQSDIQSESNREQEYKSETIARQLTEIRADIAKARHDRPYDMAAYYDSLDIPQIMKGWIDEAEAATGKLYTLDNWLDRAATDEQLLNFLQWHVDRMDKLNNDPNNEVKIGIEDGGRIHAEGIQALVEQGYLHPQAIEGAKKDPTTKILVGDIFDTLVQGRIGYASYMGFAVVGETDQRSIDTTVHELNHLNTGRLSHRWINEAITEHITKSIRTGNPGSLVEGLSTDSPYFEERAFLFRLLGKGPNKDINIPIGKLMQLYSAPDEEAGKMLADINQRLALRYFGRVGEDGQPTLDGVDYPTNILEAIGERIEEIEKNLLFHEPERWRDQPRRNLNLQAIRDVTRMLDNNPRMLMTMPDTATHPRI